MQFSEASNQQQWDTFLLSQRYSPFLQSWTMGEVYNHIAQHPIRINISRNNELVGICQCIIVPARRGRHLSIQYGPVCTQDVQDDPSLIPELIEHLTMIAKNHDCSFIRMSPFWPKNSIASKNVQNAKGITTAPHHLLAEHIWHLPLVVHNPWIDDNSDNSTQRTQDEIFMQLRKTTRNLIRRAEKEGVTIEASTDPMSDIKHFLHLHEETRKRHKFTPYTNAFFRAQLQYFSKRDECTLYLAKYNDETIAASMHMHMGGETSYHHGASTHKHSKIPASYLLQWTAICDALKRGDHIYNFWGIAPVLEQSPGKWVCTNKDHPFSGVTTFKTGYGGNLCTLLECQDIPVNIAYYGTRAFEIARKWKRGF